MNPSTPPNNATVGPVLGASVGVAVYDSLLNVSQAGAGYNTQIAVAKSLSEVAPRLGLLRCLKKRLIKRLLLQAPQAPFKAPIHSKCCIGGFRVTGLALVVVLRCD